MWLLRPYAYLPASSMLHVETGAMVCLVQVSHISVFISFLQPLCTLVLRQEGCGPLTAPTSLSSSGMFFVKQLNQACNPSALYLWKRLFF